MNFLDYITTSIFLIFNNISQLELISHDNFNQILSSKGYTSKYSALSYQVNSSTHHVMVVTLVLFRLPFCRQTVKDDIDHDFQYLHEIVCVQIFPQHCLVMKEDRWVCSLHSYILIPNCSGR